MAPSLRHQIPTTLIFLISFSALLHHTSAVSRHRHRHRLFPTSQLTSAVTPTTFFEVSRPVTHPNTSPCSHKILHHAFASTYGKPPVSAPYAPPSHCPSTPQLSSIILEWKATSHGRQFDRIFGVWLSGVELLRSCTAEPRPNGIVWTVRKDVTKYRSLLMSANQTLSVFLGNIVDKTYTGVYHVDITLHFYPDEGSVQGRSQDFKLGKPTPPSVPGWADLVMPVSRNQPTNDGLWFEIKNSTDTQTKSVAIPSNAYRAVLEVYVSFHENDEFWYSNLPNGYLESNNVTDLPGNGPFREVVVSLDGGVVGAVWPFTVIYTGGVNPLLWRPVSAIGSFDLPTYDIELTPFLGGLLDGKSHEFEFSVTNALNVWYVDANLHLWLDKKRARTKGKLLHSKAPPLSLAADSEFKGLDGRFVTGAKRSVSSSGWVRSSHGKITTEFNQELSFKNNMVMAKNDSLQIVNQTIHFDTRVSTKKPNSPAHNVELNRRFPLYMYSDQISQKGDGSYVLVANVTLGFDEEEISGSMASSLRNLQNAQGNMFVKDNLVQSGLGSTQQVYEFESTSEPCYYRSVSCSNYTVLDDNVRTGCAKKPMRVDRSSSH